jgi:lipopolysaccharide exporter
VNIFRISSSGPVDKRLERARGSFLSHVLTLATGTGVAQAVNILAMLLLARLFAPAAFGLFGLFVATVSFISVLGGARYEMAIMLPERDEDAANILVLASMTAFLIACACLGIVACLRVPLATLIGDVRLATWLWAVPAILFVNSFYQVLGFWCGRTKHFHRLAITRVVQAVGIVAGQLLLLYFHGGDGFSLIGGWILGQSLGALVLLVQVIHYEGAFLFAAYSRNGVREAAAEYWKFPAYKAPYAFVSNGASQLIFYILRVFSTLNAVGYYLVASRAVYLPVSLIATSMSQVFYEKAATEIRYGRLEGFVNRILRIQTVLGTPILIFFVFEADLLFGRFLGAQWKAAGSYAVLLAFAAYMYLLTSWLDRLFDVVGRQRLALILECGGNAASLAALTLTLVFTHNSLLAIRAFTISEVSYNILWLACAYSIAGFRLLSLCTLPKDFALAGLPVFCSALLIRLAFRSHPWLCFALTAIATVVTVGFFFLRYVRGDRAGLGRGALPKIMGEAELLSPRE